MTLARFPEARRLAPTGCLSTSRSDSPRRAGRPSNSPRRAGMPRRPFARGFWSALGVALLLAGTPALARAQDEPPPAEEGNKPPEEEGEPDLPAPPPESPPPSDEALEPEAGGDTAPPVKAATGEEALRKASKRTWKDIVVLNRRLFLKQYRLEVLPFVGTTINDNLIQHTTFGAELNFFLTEVLAIGAQGIYYVHDVLDQEFFVRYHFGRVPSLNKYLGTVTGNFSYVPIYGKFTIFNKKIFHYEAYVTGGVGVTFTEVIPRDFENEPFKNVALTFPVGIGARLFITRWLAAHLAVRSYLMLDSFEAAGRTEVDGDAAKAKAETQFINNMIATFGFSFWFPLDFKYTTFR